MPRDEARSTKKLPAVKPAYVMKMNADDARSERERAVEELHIGIVRRKLTYRVALELAWDAAIDASAKVTRQSNSDGRCPHSEQIVAAILAMKGDRNAEQSGTE